MKRLWVVVCMVGGMPLAFAGYQTTPGKRVDLLGLTKEFKQAVPALEGCDDTNGVLTCRRLTGDFTVAEKAALDAAVLAHDPDARAKAQTLKQQTAQTKLQAMGLTPQDLKDALGQ